jgi:hypothetical protein
VRGVSDAQAAALSTFAVFFVACALLTGVFRLALRRRPLAPALLAGAVACGLDYAYVGLNLLHLLSLAVASLLLGCFGAWRALVRAERLVPRVVSRR